MNKTKNIIFTVLFVALGTFLLLNQVKTKSYSAGEPWSLDETFINGNFYGEPQTGFNAAVYTAVRQSDGKIIVGGEFSTYNGVSRKYIARLNENGTLDTSFNVGTGTNWEVYEIAIQSDGKIIVVGDFTLFDGEPHNRIVRLNVDGSVDSTFNMGAGANSTVFCVKVLSSDKIIIGGYFEAYDGTAVYNLARLNADGTLDTTFNNAGSGPNWDVGTIIILPNGKIMISGYFSTYNGVQMGQVARLNADGTLDTTFNYAGIPGVIWATDIAMQEDGKVIVVGEFNDASGALLIRLNLDGTIDTTFSSTLSSQVGAFVEEVAVDSDGKILIGGTFSIDGGTPKIAAAVLNSDGSFDTGLPVDSLGAYDSITDIVVLEDTKILLGGDFTSYNGVPASFFTRIYGGSVVVEDDPLTGSIVINEGATSTTSRSVGLLLSASGGSSTISQMNICENSNFTGCDWAPYSTTKSFTLSSGNGIKTVYVKYKDSEDSISGIYSDTITLAVPTPTTVPKQIVVEQVIVETPTEEIVSTQTLVITVVDKNGSAVEGAYVKLESGASGYTDSNGVVEFQGVEEGRQSVVVSYNGLKVESFAEVLGEDNGEADNPSSLTITLNTEKAVEEEVEKETIAPNKANIWFLSLLGIAIIVTLGIILRKYTKNRS